MEKHNLDKLDHEIKRLRQAVKQLSDDDLAQALYNLIHKPGWTTPAEYALVVAAVETAQAQTDALTRHMSGLIKGARLVE
jgi:hypothetical protein